MGSCWQHLLFSHCSCRQSKRMQIIDGAVPLRAHHSQQMFVARRCISEGGYGAWGSLGYHRKAMLASTSHLVAISRSCSCSFRLQEAQFFPSLLGLGWRQLSSHRSITAPLVKLIFCHMLCQPSYRIVACLGCPCPHKMCWYFLFISSTTTPARTYKQSRHPTLPAPVVNKGVLWIQYEPTAPIQSNRDHPMQLMLQQWQSQMKRSELTWLGHHKSAGRSTRKALCHWYHWELRLSPCPDTSSQNHYCRDSQELQTSPTDNRQTEAVLPPICYFNQSWKHMINLEGGL